jgi:hypothetical protein
LTQSIPSSPSVNIVGERQLQHHYDQTETTDQADRSQAMQAPPRKSRNKGIQKQQYPPNPFIRVIRMDLQFR